MFEDALSFPFLGVQVYWFGLAVMAGLSLCFAVLYGISKEHFQLRLSVFPLSLVLMLFFSRLFFCVFDFHFHDIVSFRNILSFWYGGFSMFGALSGYFSAFLLYTHRQKQKRAALLDMAAVCILLFIAAERLGVSALEVLGRSRPLNTEWLASSFLSTEDGYLKTYLFETFCAAVLFILLFLRLRRPHADGEIMLCFLVLFSSTQLLWESLRYDSHMQYSFISIQQILYALTMAVGLLVVTRRLAQKTARIMPWIMLTSVLAATIGGAVGLEFLIDRSEINNLLLYFGYTVLIFLPIVWFFYCRRKAGVPV